MERYILPSGETTFDRSEFAGAISSLGKDLASAIGLGYRYAGHCESLHLRRGGGEAKTRDLYFSFELALRITEIHQRLEALEDYCA